MTLNQTERIARLRLFRSEGVGPITFYKLLARFGSAVNALNALPQMAQRGGRKSSPRIMTVQQAENELKLLHEYGGEMIVVGDTTYPEWLMTVEDAPPILNVIGDGSLLSKSSIGIVGARNASVNGRRFTQKIAADLGEKGQVIVSGLARGIDTAAHMASLKTGTIAVMAGGIDQVYPNENTDLYKEIVKHGCIVTEMPIGTAPTAHHFPRRNRIVSGLSKGVIVVEASMRSGSLITARLAGEQGREVFAVPGFPGDPRAAGPNHLISNGAKLIQSVDDVLTEIAAMNEKSIRQTSLFDGIAEDYTPFEYEGQVNEASSEDNRDTILQILTHTPTDVDEISRACQLPIKDIQTVLLELELAGHIDRHPGNRISKAA